MTADVIKAVHRQNHLLGNSYMTISYFLLYQL